MSTPLAEVIKSPIAANILGEHYADAEDAARQPDGDLLAIHKVGRAAVQQLREWQAGQGIPVPADTLGPGLYTYVPAQEESVRQEHRRLLAEALFREWVTIDRERNMPLDFAAVREEAFQAAEAFYGSEVEDQAPSAPESEES